MSLSIRVKDVLGRPTHLKRRVNLMNRKGIKASTFLGISILLTFSLFLPSQSYPQDSTVVETSNIAVKTAAQAIEQLVMANRIIANEGVVDALGHVSIRNPENPKTFFITRVTRALAPIEVTKKDIVEVDLDGKVVSKPSLRIGGETFIHSAILKARPEMNAVFHGHQPAIIPFTVLDIPMRPLLNTAGFIYQRNR
jgi:hypothetical protein